MHLSRIPLRDFFTLLFFTPLQDARQTGPFHEKNAGIDAWEVAVDSSGVACELVGLVTLFLFLIQLWRVTVSETESTGSI